jgi:hypothetical protein
MKIIGQNPATAHSNMKGSALSDPIARTNILRGYIHPSDWSIAAS